MNWKAELVLYFVLLVAATLALRLKDMLAAGVTLTVYSFTVALLYLSMGAVDVAFTEAVIGAGVVGVLLIIALSRTRRRVR